jgi:hypothetical protein
MEDNKFIKRNLKLSTKKIEKELIILGEDATKVYTLNDVGRYIWELADGTKTIGAIVRQIASEYDHPFEEVKKDALIFLQEADRQGDLFKFYDHPHQ